MPRIWFSFLRTYRVWSENVILDFVPESDFETHVFVHMLSHDMLLARFATTRRTRVHAMSSFSENDTSRTRACVYVAPGLSADRRVSYIHIYIHVCILTNIDIKKKKKCSKKDISRQQGTGERTRLPALSRVSIYYSCTSYTRYKG